MQFIPPETLTLMLNSIIDNKDRIPFIIFFGVVECSPFTIYMYISQAERKLSGELDAKIIVSVNKIYLYERVFTCQ